MQSIKDLSEPISLKSIITIALCVTSVVLLPLTDTLKAIKVQFYICSGKYTYDYCKIENLECNSKNNNYILHLNNNRTIDINKDEFEYYLKNKNDSEFIVFNILNRYIIFDCKDYYFAKKEANEN